ncbi:hypothetical protein BGZ83_004603 [Gryganskiella cystojenkinii]|nr:hypothetical protein BGZ83_004603 [Gryganskiella cystojenkinii]
MEHHQCPKFDALNLMLKAFKWRLHEDIPAVKYSTDDELIALYPKFDEQLESGKLYIHGRDKEDSIVVYLNIRLHFPNDQPAKTLEKLILYVIEAGRVLVKYPVEGVCLVFDLTGLSLSNVDRLGPGVWKVIQSWLDPSWPPKWLLPERTKLVAIHPCDPFDHYKSGLDKFKYKYIRSKPDENLCMDDVGTEDRLVAEWKAEWKATFWKFETLTR